MDSHDTVCQVTLILITPASQTQSWYPGVLQMSVRKPLLFSTADNLLIGPNRTKHHLIENGNSQHLAWTISGKSYLLKEFQRNIPSLSEMPED